jgi:hypothetical protein
MLVVLLVGSRQKQGDHPSLELSDGLRPHSVTYLSISSRLRILLKPRMMHCSSVLISSRDLVLVLLATRYFFLLYAAPTTSHQSSNQS